MRHGSTESDVHRQVWERYAGTPFDEGRDVAADATVDLDHARPIGGQLDFGVRAAGAHPQRQQGAGRDVEDVVDLLRWEIDRGKSARVPRNGGSSVNFPQMAR